MRNRCLWFAVATLFWTSACQPENKKEQENSTSDPLNGKAYFASASTSAASEHIIVLLRFTSSSNYKFSEAKVNSTKNTMVYRQEVGTFARSGTNIAFTATFKTCPDGETTSSYELRGDPSDTIFLKNSDGVSIKLYNAEAYTPANFNPNSIGLATEDRSCSLMAKVDRRKATVSAIKNETRTPASAQNRLLDIFSKKISTIDRAEP